jgi:hypothetical protein
LRQDHGKTRDVTALLASLACCTNDDIFNFCRIELAVSSEECVNTMRNHVVGSGQIKCATKGLCKAGANTIHDYYVTHKASPLIYAAKKDVHCALNPTV